MATQLAGALVVAGAAGGGGGGGGSTGTNPLTPPPKYLTTAPIALNSAQATIDSIPNVAGDTWVLTQQTNPLQDGLYTANGAAANPPLTAVAGQNYTGLILWVASGSNSQAGGNQAGGAWLQMTPNPVFGTTPLVFGQFQAPISSDGLQAVPSLRSLGVGGQQAMPGDFWVSDLPATWHLANMPRKLWTGATATTNASPMALAVRMWFPNQYPINFLRLLFAVAATAPTHWWYAVCDQNLNALAFTADQAAAATPIAPAEAPLALATVWNGAAYVAGTQLLAPAEGDLYVVVNMVATTPATLIANAGAASLTGIAPIMVGQAANPVNGAPPTGGGQYAFGALTAKGPMPIIGVS